VSANGAFSPAPIAAGVSGNKVVISIPAASAALLILH
jgi:hypothetical protein